MTDEHDDLLDERRLLASAYLDDELTPAERARADADPAVLAEVEALRSVRAALAAVPAPDPGRRDAAIAAAMAAAATTVTAPPRPTVAARRRTRWYAPLAAAAVAVLVVGGIVALQDGGGDDDSSADTVREAPVAAQTDEEDGAERDAGGTASTAPAATTAAAAAPPDAAAPTTVATATEGTQGAGDFAESTTEEATEETLTGALVVPVIIADADDLRDVVTFLTAANPADGSDAPDETATAYEPQCELGRFIIAARYEPSDGPARDVEIFVLDDGGELVAADATTCVVVLRAMP